MSPGLLHHRQVPREWVETVVRWAADQPGVERVYLYGSRVKGTARPDSDLDVAVVARAVGDETEETVRQFGQREWAAALNEMLPVKVHLQAYDPKTDTKYVGPGVTEHGVCVYDRSDYSLGYRSESS